MIVIIATINRPPMMHGFEKAFFKEKCQFYGIQKVICVNTKNDLESTLKAPKETDIIIFSNFPPNSSYPDRPQSYLSWKNNKSTEPTWGADSYIKSMEFFKGLNAYSAIKAIHFVSSAPETKLTKTMVENLFENISVSYNDIDDPYILKPYSVKYQKFMISKIEEFVTKAR